MSYIELKQWEVRHIPSGNVVDTGTLGPCIGVIIHDKERREAYAGHFVDSECDGLEDMVKDVISRFNNPPHLDVYVAGNSVDDEDFEEREYDLQNREFVSQLLRKYGFLDSKIYIRWSPSSCNVHLWLNVDTAENELEVTLDSEETGYRGDIRKAPNPL